MRYSAVWPQMSLATLPGRRWEVMRACAIKALCIVFYLFSIVDDYSLTPPAETPSMNHFWKIIKKISSGMTEMTEPDS